MNVNNHTYTTCVVLIGCIIKSGSLWLTLCARTSLFTDKSNLFHWRLLSFL